MFEILGGIVVFTCMVLLSGIKVVKEYNQLVVFRFGKVAAAKGPGVHMVIPIIDQGQTVDTRTITITTPVLEEMTSDHVSIKLSAVCMFNIVDAKKAVSKIDDVTKATNELVQTSLRTIVAQHDLRHLMSDRGRMNSALKSKLEKQTREWGVRVTVAEVKEIKIPKEMKKALLRAKRHHHDHHF